MRQINCKLCGLPFWQRCAEKHDAECLAALRDAYRLFGPRQQAKEKSDEQMDREALEWLERLPNRAA